jgi:hypothetical protein
MAVSEEKTIGGARRYTAADRLMTIAPMLAHNRGRKCVSIAIRPRDRWGRFDAGRYGRSMSSLDAIACQIAAEHHLSSRTVWRWFCLYQRAGHAGLAKKKRVDIGRSNWLHKRPYFQRMIQARLAAGQNPFAIWKSLRQLYSYFAPSYEVVLNTAKHRYSNGGSPDEVQGIAESAATR